MTFDLQLVAQTVAGHLLNAVPEGLLLAAFAWLLLRLLGRQNSRTRFAVYFAALLAVAAMPFVPAASLANASVSASGPGIRPELTLPSAYALGLAGAWALIAVAALLRLAVGLWRVGHLRRSSSSVAESLDPELTRQINEFRSLRKVEVRVSSEIRVPAALGFLRPAVLIPEWALRELPAEELRVILLHELEHLRRRDDWTNLLQKIMGAVFFFHPAVWWIEKQLGVEREMACDEAVIAETGCARAYAESLVSLAEKSAVRRGLLLAQAAISRARETRLRLARILDVDRPKATRLFKPALLTLAAFSAVCLVLRPETQLIGFESPAPELALVMPAVPPSLTPEPGIIPAALHRTAGMTGKSPVQKAATPKVRPTTDSSAAIAVHREHRALRPPQVVPAAAKQVVPSQPLFVVMQTTEFGADGSTLVRLTVWKLTLNQKSAAVMEGRAAKSL